MTDIAQRATRPPMAGVREVGFKLRDTSVDGQISDGLTLDGYASVFGPPGTVIRSWEGNFREIVAPGAMRKSFRELKPVVQFDHGTHPLIGSLPVAQLISAAEETDPILAPNGGAHIVARLIDTWLTSPLREAIKAGAVSGMSFRFEVLDEAWESADGTPLTTDMAVIRELEKTWDGTIPDDELPLRTLKELRIPELGPVTFPAYEKTSIMVRGGTLDLDRLDDPGQRELLARAIFTMDGAAHEHAVDAAARGEDVGLDESLRLIRGMLLNSAERRQRKLSAGAVDMSDSDARGSRDIDVSAQQVRAMLSDAASRKQRVAEQDRRFGAV
jgi:HK97 family phage prohead protease